MKKFYDILLWLLIIAAIIVIVLIGIKYGKNRINESQIAESLTEMEAKLEQVHIDAETAEPIEQSYKGYSVVGIIEIPKIGIKYPILSETNDASMKISITKFWGPNVNEIGNLTLAGHNNRDGTLFGKTSRLEEGDMIKLTDLMGKTKEYAIFQIYTIDPNDVSIVNSVDENTCEVTLITCTNGHKNRLITKAREIQ